MDKFRHLLSAHENCFQKNTPTQNIKMTCGGSGENVCAVIAVLAVIAVFCLILKKVDTLLTL